MGSSSKCLQIVNAGEDVKRKEPCNTVGGNINWYSHNVEQYEHFSEPKKSYCMILQAHHMRAYIWKNRNSRRYMHFNVHCNRLMKCISYKMRLESWKYSLIHGPQNGCCISKHKNNFNLVVHLPQSSWVTRYVVNEQYYLNESFFLNGVSTVGLIYWDAINRCAVIQDFLLQL